MIQVSVNQLYKRFGRRPVLRGLTFEHTSGILGVGGRNGSGKSTLLKCLGGLLKPGNGVITWEIEGNTLDAGEIQPHVGFLAPHISMYENLTCRENLSFIADLRSPLDPAPDLSKLLDRVGLWEHSHQLFGALSTGQQQRLKFASALLHRPHILLLDEPGTNLDEEGRRLIRETIERYKADDKMVILASNNPSELDWCDHCIYVDQ